MNKRLWTAGTILLVGLTGGVLIGCGVSSTETSDGLRTTEAQSTTPASVPVSTSAASTTTTKAPVATTSAPPPPDPPVDEGVSSLYAPCLVISEPIVGSPDQLADDWMEIPVSVNVTSHYPEDLLTNYITIRLTYSADSGEGSYDLTTNRHDGSDGIAMAPESSAEFSSVLGVSDLTTQIESATVVAVNGKTEPALDLSSC